MEQHVNLFREYNMSNNCMPERWNFHNTSTFIEIIEVKFRNPSPRCPPRFAPLIVLSKQHLSDSRNSGLLSENDWDNAGYEITIHWTYIDSTHWTPCQASKQGSPPLGTHPGSKGDPSAVYKLFMAKTTRKTKYDL